MDKLIPAFIELNLEVQNKFQLISSLVDKFDQKGILSEKKEYLDAVLERENLLSTYCGYNVAIPHAVSKAVKKAAFGFCRITPIEWDKDDEKVQFILILAIPDSSSSKNNRHIDMMSQIAGLALEDKVRKIWKSAKTKDIIIKTFQ
jgi:mannitol/fructose-specific phosphotransferase system IIA component (Ntr-type)